METKNVLVVGSSGGIGNETAKMLLDAGYNVIGTYYKDFEMTAKLRKHARFQAKEVDIKNVKQIKSLFASITSELYAIVNCAGIVKYENNDIDSDVKIWDETIATNLSSNFYLAKIFRSKIVENGRFVMMSSTDSYYGGAITASYAASKNGVNSLTKSLSLLLRDKKIRVNSIAPGWVLTPMTEVNGPDFLGKVANINPLKRNALPGDIAKIIKFLLSDDSDYINGQVISADGGYTNQDPTLLLEEEEH